MVRPALMKPVKFTSLLPFLSIACTQAAPPAEAPQPAHPPQEPAPVEDAPEEPTAEELAEEAKAQKLAEDRAKMQGDAQVELKRWTPELREKAKALATARYAKLKPAMAAALASEHRVPGNADRDPERHPLETLEFFGMTPKLTVLEYGPGGGWYTELLAPVLATEGELLVTTADPNGPQEDRQTFYAERLKLFLTKAPEVYGKVQPVTYDPDAPDLALEETIDLALVIRGVHGWIRNGQLETWLQQIHRSLKPGGVLGIVQHRAKEGADPQAAAEKGYVPEAWLIEQVKALGFELSAKSEINQNSKDTAEHPEGVWTLPPTLRLGEQDRQKYMDIGESDRMTLRFTKVAPQGK